MTREELQDLVCEKLGDDTGALLADAAVGVDMQSERVVYSYAKGVQVLMDRDGMTQEDAIEFMSYNVLGSLAEAPYPVWVDLFREEDKDDD